MPENIQFLPDERKVLVPDSILKKLKYSLHATDNFRRSQLNHKMSMNTFSDIVIKILKESREIIQRLPKKDNEINFPTDYLDALKETYYALYPENKKTNSLFLTRLDEIDKINERYDYVNKLVDIIYKIKMEEEKYYLICDLQKAKKDCLENMKYFIDDSSIISKFNEEYERASQASDTKKMLDMLVHI